MDSVTTYVLDFPYYFVAVLLKWVGAWYLTRLSKVSDYPHKFLNTQTHTYTTEREGMHTRTFYPLFT